MNYSYYLQNIHFQTAVNIICADEDIERHFGLPSFGIGNSSGLNFPFSDLFGQLPLPFSFGSRQERSAEPQESEETEPQDRLGYYVSCNYTAEVSNLYINVINVKVLFYCKIILYFTYAHMHARLDSSFNIFLDTTRRFTINLLYIRYCMYNCAIFIESL